MSTRDHHDGGKGHRANRVLALSLVALVAGMVGLSYAAVPLYRIFCQVTGFAGTTRVAQANSGTATGIPVTVRFDANIARELDWSFAPEQTAIELKAGETRLAFFRASNRSDRPLTGTATFNVTPNWTGQYFNKIECFCFTEQTLQPGETVDMPVSFFIDPKIAEDRAAPEAVTITLSYTFYPVADANKPLADATTKTGTARRPGS